MHGRHLIITCEHAGNKIPVQFKGLFKGEEFELNSHRGWDPGAYPIACYLAEKLKVNLHSNIYSRLLIEYNRSLDHPQLFSSYTENLPGETKKLLIEKYYQKYRSKVDKEIEASLRNGIPVLHLSIHTFTPSLNGVKRNADVGILFDPKRIGEKKFSKALKSQLLEQNNTLRVKYNYPYLGIDDGFTSYLRKLHPNHEYWGIEIEVNQQIATGKSGKKIQNLLYNTLRKMYFK